MINLLPPELKSSYSYGRRNVGLRRWALLCLAALVGLGILSTYGLLSLHQQTLNYNKQITTAQTTLQKEKYSQVQAQVKDITNNFRLVVQVLSQEVLFSQLLTHIATITPANANLTGLNISGTQGALDISAITTDYNAATQLQVNLADPSNQIFNKADIISINCASNTTNPKYPCSINIRAQFAKNNPFLFINNKAAKP